MRIKKLITTFICTFCLMTLTVQVKAQYDYEKVSDIMQRLSIYVCFDTSNKDAMVSRGEFAASLLNLMNIQAYDGNADFKDINNSVHKKQICTAMAMGIVANAEHFRPDDVITYSEAVTMIINAIGYKETAVLHGGYPNGYISLAASLGITDGIGYNAGDKISAENAIMLLFNAGNTNIYKHNIGGSVYDKEVGDSVFYEYHDISYGIGILDANTYTSLDMTRSIADNMVSINGEIFEIYYNSAVTEKLGNYVEFYYKTNSDDSRVILFIDDFKKMNEIITVPFDDVLDYESGVLKYYDGGYKSENIPLDIPVIYNGVATLSYNLADGSSIFEQENGEIVLVDNNRDRKIDVVRITAYDNYFVSDVNKTDGIIYDKYDTTKKIDFTEIEGKDNNLWVITDKEGNVIDVSQIEENNVVSTARSLDDNVLRAVVSQDSIVGTVTGKRSEGTGVFVTVNGSEYRLSPNLNSYMANIGTIGEFYLDYVGNIAGIKFDTSKKAYGFFIKTFYDPNEEELFAKFLGQDGMLRKSVKFSKKGTIDGVRYNSWEEVETLLALSEGYEKTHYPFRVIVYKINAEGELNFIDTDSPNVSDNYSLRRLSAETELSGLYYTDTSVLDNKFYVGSAVIFKTPPKTDANGNINPAIYDDTQYRVLSTTDLTLGRNWGLVAYSTNPESVLPECIITSREPGGNTIATTSPYMLVTDKYVGLNDDEVPALIFEGWKNKNKIKISVSENYLAALDPDDIVAGDFIKYSEDGLGEMTSAIKVFDYVSKEEGPFRTTVKSDGYLEFGSQCHLDIGTLYAIENGVVMLKDSVMYGPEAAFGPFDPTYKPKTSTKIFIVKPTGRSIPEIEDVSTSIDRIKDKFHHGETNKVLIYNQAQNMNMMVVYE